MSPRALTRALGAVCAVCAPLACGFDQSVAPDAIIRCNSDADCPQGFVCPATFGRCVDPAVIEPTPPAVSAEMQPNVARAGDVVTLTLTFNVGVAEDTEPLLSFTPADPGFVLTSGAGGTFAYRLTAPTDAERTFRLTDAAIVDAQGSVRSFPVDDVALRVDNVVPAVIIGPLLGGIGGGGALFSDLAGSREFSVEIDLGEAVRGDPLALLGTRALTCATDADVALRFRCETIIGLGIDDDDTDGTVGLVIVATDLAGNVGQAARSVSVDLLPPAIDESATRVRVLRFDGREVTSGVAIPGDTVLVDVGFDEPFTGVPVLTSTDPALLELQLTSSFVRSASFVGEVGFVGADVVAGFVVDVADAVGHAAGVPLPVGVTLGTVAPSPCVATGADGVAVCTDFDGDGHFGFSPACTPDDAPTDCDDADPLSFPGAPEVPGDGRDNDCARDGDLPLDETVAIFALPGETTAFAGTRSEPTSLANAMARADAEGLIVVVAAGAVPDPGAIVRPHTSVFGGRDPSTWEPSGDLTTAPSMVIENTTAPVALDSLEMGFVNPLAGLTVISGSTIGGALLAGPVVSADNRWGNVEVFVGGGRSAFLGDDIRFNASVAAEKATFARVRFRGSVTLGGGADVDIVTCLFSPEAPIRTAVNISGGVRIGIFHSVIAPGPGTVAFVVERQPSATVLDLLLAGNIFRLGTGPNNETPAIFDNGPSIRYGIVNNVFDLQPPPGSLIGGVFTGDQLAEFEECGFASCIAAAGNFVADPGLAAGDPLHLAPTSPFAHDNLISVVGSGAPTLAAGDIDGDCRGAFSSRGTDAVP